MNLFDRIPDNFFSILSSPNKVLYVEALFVIRRAFKNELTIHRVDLSAMLMDSLERDMMDSDLSQDMDEAEKMEDVTNLSGKASFLIRKFRDTGWIETEYEAHSFEENITIPDYAIEVINLLWDLSINEKSEYNSYVYATYASLENSRSHPDYRYQALRAAWQNTVRLIDELKSLYNNIRRYLGKMSGEMDVNALLATHFDEYKEKIVEAVYYPLKTMDSVPRFRGPIRSILNEWMLSDQIIDDIVRQGVERGMFEQESAGREETLSMINFIVDTYEGIDGMLEEIDRKHTAYTNASIDKIRYLIHVDQSIRGKLADLLQHADRPVIAEAMADSIHAQSYLFVDNRSLYDRVKRTRLTEGSPQPLTQKQMDETVVESFLEGVRKQYTNKKIDAYIEMCFGERDVFSTQEAQMESMEDFILFMLGTMRGREKTAAYTISFLPDNCELNGYSLPRVIFKRKQDRSR